MRRLKDEPLSKYTTFKIGGSPKELVIPDNENELIEEIKRCKREGIKYRILGNGSNLLVDDRGLNEIVIKNTEACNDIERNLNTVNVGSSVSLQKFVKFCVENDLEGMEYLFSIPGTIGGAVYMNAGRGRKHNLSISNNLKTITVFDGEKIREFKKKDLKFDYRYSELHEHQNWVILNATFKLDNQTREIGEKKIKERMNFVKENQNRLKPSAGSIFKEKSRFAIRLLNGVEIGGAKMEGNWISNVDNASFQDVMWLIIFTKVLSYLSFKKPELEIEIWI